MIALEENLPSRVVFTLGTHVSYYTQAYEIRYAKPGTRIIAVGHDFMELDSSTQLGNVWNKSSQTAIGEFGVFEHSKHTYEVYMHNASHSVNFDRFNLRFTDRGGNYVWRQGHSIFN